LGRGREKTFNNIGARAQENIGRLVDDAQTQAEGVTKQVKGAAQDLYGQAREGASEIADAATETAAAERQTASSFERSLRNTIGTQPYTAVFVALVG
jgi:uncharacterized protein YjbJ (UPF0337 family)